MSAIAGLIHLDGRPCEPSALDALANLLRHRAPDGIATWHDGPAGLIHGRLITTPESGRERQPIVDNVANVAMTFDGRLDNRADLLRALDINDDLGASLGDAALVLQLYRAHGTACVERLLGDFAFAIWDGAQSRLLCARDHLGIRPLCYRSTPQRIAWASEAGALARFDGQLPAINEGMVAEHLSGIITSTSQTLFGEIFRLPAGHLLTADAGGISVWRYWSPDLTAELRYDDPTEYVEQLRDLVKTAVAARLRVSGSVGLSLSGGIDSSSVGGIAATLCRDRSVPATHIDAFSLLDDGPSNEREFWSQVVDRWQLASEEVAVAPLPDGQLAAEARFYLDVPNSPLAGMMDRLRLRVRAHGARVALTGIGGDEWLGPSPFAYADLLRRGRLAALTQRLRGDAADEWFMGWPSAMEYALWPNVPRAMQPAVRRVLRRGQPPEWMEPAFAARVGLRDRLERHAIDLPYDSLERYDTWHEGISGSSAFIEETIERSSARVGVEMWHPFMDLRIVTFGLALPSAQRWRDGRAKDLLRRAAAPYLPERIAARTSSPDATHRLFEGLGPEGGRALFENMAAARRGWVREEVLRARFDRATAWYRAGDRRYAPLAMMLWRVAAVELWARALAAETVFE